MTIKFNDFIIFYLERTQFNCIQLKQKAFIDTKFGRFKHDDFVGKNYGDKIASKNNRGFVYILRLTPQFYSKTLKQQTQIIFFQDISLILHYLQLEPNSVVVESGTGSGSLSFSISQTIKKGKLFSFEFNQERAEYLQNLFKQMNLTNVKITQRDVIKNGFQLSDYEKADAIFLDLPSPNLVIKFAKDVLKKNGNLCSFSPSIEQIQQTAQELVKNGFGDIRMINGSQINYNRKHFLKTNPFGENEKIVSFQIGEKKDKTHTGYLLFAKNLFNQVYIL